MVRLIPVISMVAFFPVLFQAQPSLEEVNSRLPIETDAREFMAAYAEDLRAGRRQSIIKRYDKRGAYRVGEGEKTFETPAMIQAAYLTQWTPPTTFEWRNLSYEPLGENVIMVIGLFDWGLANGTTVSFSYTGLLHRQDGVLRIRLEDESMARRRKD
jgi:hypothetical protein